MFLGSYRGPEGKGEEGAGLGSCQARGRPFVPASPVLSLVLKGGRKSWGTRPSWAPGLSAGAPGGSPGPQCIPGGRRPTSPLHVNVHATLSAEFRGTASSFHGVRLAFLSNCPRLGSSLPGPWTLKGQQVEGLL